MERERVILVVDDVELNRAILYELFRGSYRIAEAANGEEAIRAIETYGESIAVILLDTIMPVKSGFEVLAYMNQTGGMKQIPVIMITAENSEHTVIQGYQMGAADIIRKPFQPDIVQRRVKNIIELYEHKNELEKRVNRQMRTIKKQAQKLRRTNTFVLDALSTAVEFRDHNSRQHVKNVRILTKSLLERMAEKHPEYELTPDKIELITMAAALHDIGKIGIPDAVLLKPEKLTEDEFEIVKSHTLCGCDIISQLDHTQDEDYYAYCYEICRHHHERWDGSGYPDGISGEEIPIWVQAVALADAYDALTSERVYRTAYSHKQAVQMIQDGECGVFHPSLLACFVKDADNLHNRLHSEMMIQPLCDGIQIDCIPDKSRNQMSLSQRTLWLLEFEREKYRILSDLTGEIIFNYCIRTDTIEFSEKYYEIFGSDITVSGFIENMLNSSVIYQEHKKKIFDAISRISIDKSLLSVEVRLRVKNGTYEWFRIDAKALWDVDNEFKHIGYIGKITSIHEQKRIHELLKMKADTDCLTGLYNRTALRELALSFLKANKEVSSAVMFVDVDNFKEINDDKGHLFGDKILKYISDQIRKTFRSTDIACRMGGDEFVIFIKDISSREVLEDKVRKLCESFEKSRSNIVDARGVSISIGIAQCPKDGNDFDELLHKADKALYFVKNSCKGMYAFYKGDMETKKCIQCSRQN